MGVAASAVAPEHDTKAPEDPQTGAVEKSIRIGAFTPAGMLPADAAAPTSSIIVDRDVDMLAFDGDARRVLFPENASGKRVFLPGGLAPRLTCLTSCSPLRVHGAGATPAVPPLPRVDPQAEAVWAALATAATSVPLSAVAKERTDDATSLLFLRPLLTRWRAQEVASWMPREQEAVGAASSPVRAPVGASSSGPGTPLEKASYAVSPESEDGSEYDSQASVATSSSYVSSDAEEMALAQAAKAAMRSPIFAPPRAILPRLAFPRGLLDPTYAAPGGFQACAAAHAASTGAPFGKPMGEDHRRTAIDWLLDVVQQEKLSSGTLERAVQYMDRILSRAPLPRRYLQHCLLTCLWMAAKHEEVEIIELRDITAYTCAKAERTEEHTQQMVELMQAMEVRLTTLLEWKLGGPTPRAFLHAFAFASTYAPIPGPLHFDTCGEGSSSTGRIITPSAAERSSGGGSGERLLPLLRVDASATAAAAGNSVANVAARLAVRKRPWDAVAATDGPPPHPPSMRPAVCSPSGAPALPTRGPSLLHLSRPGQGGGGAAAPGPLVATPAAPATDRGPHDRMVAVASSIAEYHLTLALFDVPLLATFPSSVLAAAALYIARREVLHSMPCGASGGCIVWPGVLRVVTGYEPRALAEAVARLTALRHSAEESSRVVARESVPGLTSASRLSQLRAPALMGSEEGRPTVLVGAYRRFSGSKRRPGPARVLYSVYTAVHACS
jgi:hypothetical protein